MANLIPPDAKKVVRKEYWYRTLSVWLFLISLPLLVFSTLLVPTYILFSSQIRALLLEEQYMQMNNSEMYKSAVSTIQEANMVAQQLEDTQDTLPSSEILNAIEAAQSSTISLSRFTYQRSGNTIHTIMLGGTATDRASLASFKEVLERNPLFVQAEVPVSDLAKDRDLPFTIEISVASLAQ